MTNHIVQSLMNWLHPYSESRITEGRARREVLDRARHALRAGQLSLAQSIVGECGDTAYQNAACLNVLGLIAEAQDNWDSARHCWSRALQFDPNYIPAYDNLRRYFEMFQLGRTRIFIAFGDELRYRGAIPLEVVS